jgi:hypothetical protein
MKRKSYLSAGEVYRLPEPPVSGPSPQAFVFCPLVLLQGLTLEQWLLQQWMYRRALEEATAVAKPSLPERDLLAVWN